MVVVFTLGGDTLLLFILCDAASGITLIVGAGIGLGRTMRNISAKRHSATVGSVTIVFYGSTVDRSSMAWMIFCAV